MRPALLRSPSTRRALAGLICLSALAAACGAEDQSGDSVDVEPSFPGITPDTELPTTTESVMGSPEAREDATTTAAPPAATTTFADPAALPALALTPVATLDEPIATATRPGVANELWIAERVGLVRVLDVVSGAVSDPILDITGDTTAGGEQGLLGLAIAPDGGYLYLSYTDPSGDTRLDEFRVAPDGTVDAASRTVVLQVDQPAGNHNGGNVVFGPDGHLWFGLGDGGGGDDPFDQAQDPDTLLGSMLRLDPPRGSGAPYTVPADNPFVSGGGRPENVLIGLRNPWRFSFDPLTGDLWIGDVGQNAIEEIDLLRAADGWRLGANLGWPLFEGAGAYLGSEAPANHVPPIYEYGRDVGCSVTGGVVYRGSSVPGLGGVYLYGDYCEGRVRALVPDASGAVTAVDLALDVPGGKIASFGADSAGEVYVLSLDGGVFRIVTS